MSVVPERLLTRVDTSDQVVLEPLRTTWNHLGVVGVVSGGSLYRRTTTTTHTPPVPPDIGHTTRRRKLIKGEAT